MSLYQHPALCHHLFLLCRWRPRDATDLTVIVTLLHLTVACQYVLCGLYWGYTRRTRPELAEDSFFVLGVAAPVAAAVYTVCNPLGKASSPCKLACSGVMVSDTKQRLSPVGHVVVEPEWAGGMLVLLLLGLLDAAFPAPADRSRWVETNN